MKEETHLRAIVEHCSAVMLAININGLIGYANPSAERILGYQRSELVGMEFTALIHPECLEDIEKLLDEAIREQKHGTFKKLKVLCKNGEWRLFEGDIVGSVEESGNILAVLSMMDVTDQLERIRSLQKRAEYFDILAETAKDMIYVLDEDNIIRFVNRYGASVFGKNPEDIIGMRMESLFPSHIASEQRKNVERVFREGKPLNIEAETVFPSGRAWIDTWLVPIKDQNGNVIQVLGLSRDITSRHESKIQLEQRTRQAEEASLRAQEYFDYLAHDIANLVAPIMTYAETISQKEEISEDIKKYALKIIEQVKEIATFLLNLRTLAEAQKADAASVESLDLAECISEIVNSVEEHYPNRKFRLHYERPSYERVLVVGGKYIRNMLAIELDRAARYAHNQDIDVWITIYPVTNEFGLEFWEMNIKIPDLALPSKFSEMLSTPFNIHRAKSEKRRTSRNLSFLASAVEHFGGKLWFEDVVQGFPEKGFSMKIRLPKASV